MFSVSLQCTMFWIPDTGKPLKAQGIEVIPGDSPR